MVNDSKGKDKQNTIREINVDNLFLDYENLRLTKSGKITSEKELLKELCNRYDVSDVLASLAQHGYFSEEPLIGIPKDNKLISKAKEFIIVEGNRRLAALKLLLYKKYRDAVGSIKIPEISSNAKGKLDPVPVKIYAQRSEIIPYLGVRHITGVRPWDTQSKAKYIQSLVEKGVSIKEVTKMVASRSDVVGRSLLTLYILKQANKYSNQPWEEEAKGFKFSLLYTALGYLNIRNAIGLPEDSLQNPRANLVPLDRKAELIDLMRFIYGTPDGSESSKIPESRNLKELASIYGNKEALDFFKAGASISQAYRKSGGEIGYFLELIKEVSYKLDETNGIAPHYRKNEEALRWAKRCNVSANHLLKTLEE